MSSDHKQVNASVRYQLVTGTDTSAPYRYAIRDSWEEVADDAVNMGAADWVTNAELKLRPGAKIERVK